MNFKLIIPESKIFYQYQQKFLNLVDGVEYKSISNVKSLFNLTLFHSGENIITQKDFCKANLKKTKLFLTRNNIQLISYDLGPMSLHYRSNKIGQFIIDDSLLSEQKFLDFLEKHLNAIRSAYNGAIAIENLPYYKTGAYDGICDPKFIKYIVKQYGIFLVLDLPHAFISAVNLKRDFVEYIQSLPLTSVIEMHLSRPFIMNRIAIDLHDKLKRRDYDFLFEFLRLKNFPKLKYLTVEYYRNYRNIKEQFQKIKELLS